VRASVDRLRRVRVDPVRLDRALAVVLTAVAAVNLWHDGWFTAGRAAPTALQLLVTAAVAVRRRWPASVGLAAIAIMGVKFAFWSDPGVIAVAVAYFCLLYGLTVWTPSRRFWLGIAAAPVAFLLTALGPKATLSSTGLFSLVTPLVMVLIRRVVGDRERRAELAERERDVAAREAVVAERARIARELHDVVAHGVSVMVVQAQAGPRLLADPGRAGDAFRSIETTGKQALVELRRLLGVLRGGDEVVPVAPQPGLASLESLVDQVRRAGMRVALRVEGEPQPLPPGLDLSAYRIVQEALTNTLKHAGRAEAEVVVRYDPGGLELEIVDNGSGPSSNGNGAGHGLVGMRERVALYGGVLHTGSRNGHGYAVRARLPLAAEPGP
jgi:signal transduction histidine kinase